MQRHKEITRISSCEIGVVSQEASGVLKSSILNKSWENSQ